MTSKRKPGSIASEAARLSIELGFFVTPDKVRWWRKKKYDLHDIPGLKKNLRNQQIQPTGNAKLLADSPEADEDPSLAYRLITDDIIADSKDSIPVAAVLEYLRDQWEANERSLPQLLAMKSEDEIREIVMHGVGMDWWLIHTVLPIYPPPAPEWLKAMLFPDDPALRRTAE